MGWIQEAGRGIKERVLNTPGLRVLVLAIRNYILHQSANQAGSLAFSSVLAMFPLLILLSASAGYIGKPGDAAQLASRVMEYAPQLVREVMQPVINQVLAQRNQALLAIGVVVTLWTASSGMQAIRSALNRAYGIERGLAFWKARIKVTLFTVVVGSAILVAFSSVVILPYVWQMLADNVGEGPDVHWVRNAVRYALAYLVLVALYALMYGWLPDIRQRIYTVLARWWARPCGWARPQRCLTPCAPPASWRCSTAASRAWWPPWCFSTSAPPRSSSARRSMGCCAAGWTSARRRPLHRRSRPEVHSKTGVAGLTIGSPAASHASKPPATDTTLR
jgi:membrane protein